MDWDCCKSLRPIDRICRGDLKRENVDGNSQTGDDYVATANGHSTYGYGCEMTLYMTTDPLQSGSPVVKELEQELTPFANIIR